MKKEIVTVILISILIVPSAQAFATETYLNERAIEYTEETDVKNINLAEDVFIEGLYENSVLYVGADISVKGSVDKKATQKEVSWQVTGNNGVIDFESSGNYAKITGKSSGAVWVMARAGDGSDKAREYTVNVSEYPKDATSQLLIGKNIIPVLRRPFRSNEAILRVEVSKSLSSSKVREEALKAYIRKLAAIGNLSNEGMYSDEYYEYYIININRTKVEVRVSKNDSAYSAFKNILSNVSEFNNGQVDVGGEEKPNPPSGEDKIPSTGGVTKPPGEGDKIPSTGGATKPPSEGDKVPSTGGMTKPPGEENEVPSSEGEIKPSSGKDESAQIKIPLVDVTQGIEDIIILGGTGTSSDDPIIVTLENSLSSEEKIATMASYLIELKRRKRLSFIRRIDEVDSTSYIVKASQKITSKKSSKKQNKNDFFIEIKVKKDDQEAYIPIIEMLNDLEKEELIDVEDGDLNDEKDKNSIKENKVVIGSNKEVMEKDKEVLGADKEVIITDKEGLGAGKESSEKNHAEAQVNHDKNNQEGALKGQDVQEEGRKKTKTSPKSILIFLVLGLGLGIKKLF